MYMKDGKYYIESASDLLRCRDSSGTLIADRIKAPKDQTVLWSGYQQTFPNYTLNDPYFDEYSTDHAIPAGGYDYIPSGTEDVNNYYGPEIASYVAHEHGGQTLEDTLAANNIVLPEWSQTDPESQECWKQASRIFAGNAEGNVKVVVGEELNPEGYLYADELPTIQNNANVDSITLCDSYPSSAGGKADKHFAKEEFYGNDDQLGTAKRNIDEYNNCRCDQIDNTPSTQNKNTDESQENVAPKTSECLLKNDSPNNQCDSQTQDAMSDLISSKSQNMSTNNVGQESNSPVQDNYSMDGLSITSPSTKEVDFNDMSSIVPKYTKEESQNNSQDNGQQPQSESINAGIER